MNSLEEIYHAVLLEHANNSPFRGLPEGEHLTVIADNPLCGDSLELALVLKEGRIQKAHFDGKGCTISLAAASLVSECMQGLSPAEGLALLKQYRQWMRGEPIDDSAVGELKVLAGVKRLPIRIRCALLASEALEKSFQHSEGENNGAD